jgi:hypothetical protein
MHFSGRILRVGEETVLYRWEGQRTLLLSHVVFFLGWLCFLIRQKKRPSLSVFLIIMKKGPE